MTKAIVNVAIGILLHQSKVLVGWREAKQHQGNKYEFPGGKVEQGETPEQACRREILEEVGVDLQTWHAFDLVKHEYDDIHVHLHVFHGFVGQQQLQDIHQPWTWYARNELQALNFPKANDAIIARLVCHPYLKITDQFEDIYQLVKNTTLYLRVDHQLDSAEFVLMIQQINQLPTSLLNLLIVNVDVWQQLASSAQKQISAIHYKQKQLMQLSDEDLVRGVRSIAACHDENSLTQAQKLGLDALILSPVLPTATHPNSSHLGWQKFKELIQHVDIPVYALGGLKPDDLTLAQANQAYGVAGISQF